jgi:FAD-dependent urate hydroxylase
MTPALIIGAGIAGPVAAMALQRAHIKSVVYEAGGPATGDGGPYVTVAANGLDALSAIGVDGLVAAGGFVTRSTAFFRASGQHLGTIGMGSDSVTIRRARLQRLLQEEASSRGVPFEFGRRLAGAAIAPGGAEAWFHDRSFETGGMLIGCDGVHSEVRQVIDREARPPRNLGLLNFRGYTPSIEAGTPGRWQMIFGRRAFFSYAVDPTGGTAWFATVAAAPVVEHHGVTSNEDWMRILIDHFHGDAGPAIPLIAAGTLELTASPTDDLPHVRQWHRGALIVIGDAAHAAAPASGQGVSLAIEDGVLLAKYLRQLPTAPAFAAFAQARRRRVERIVAQGARASRYRVPAPAGRIIRDLTLPLMFRYLVTERSFAWMHNHRVEWHQPVVNA